MNTLNYFNPNTCHYSIPFCVHTYIFHLSIKAKPHMDLPTKLSHQFGPSQEIQSHEYKNNNTYEVFNLQGEHARASAHFL